jgi:competence protein ComEA
MDSALSMGAGTPKVGMESLSPRGPWGWNVAARYLLLLGATSGAMGLLTAAPPQGGTLSRAPTLQVDPNTAPPEVLGALPRIGPVLARAITVERQRAPFRSLDDLDRRVRRIGPATITALRPHLRFDPTERPAPPISVARIAGTSRHTP